MYRLSFIIGGLFSLIFILIIINNKFSKYEEDIKNFEDINVLLNNELDKYTNSTIDNKSNARNNL